MYRSINGNKGNEKEMEGMTWMLIGVAEEKIEIGEAVEINFAIGRIRKARFNEMKIVIDPELQSDEWYVVDARN